MLLLHIAKLSPSNFSLEIFLKDRIYNLKHFIVVEVLTVTMHSQTALKVRVTFQKGCYKSDAS